MMAFWMRRGLVACLLLPLSLLMRLLVAGRRAAYAAGLCRSVRLPVPVIVVGNLFVGGTGKTPLTIWLVETLRHAGYHPGVISRGHGRADAATQMVLAQSSPRQVGDEPVLIVQRTGCPLVVGRDRVAAGQALLAAYPETDVLVSDDGLQHYRLMRDIEIVLSDGRGAGNGWLLPAGPLREPLSRRRDFSVLNVGSRRDDAAPLDTADRKLDGGHPAVVMQLDAPLAEQLQERGRCRSLVSIAASVPPPSITAAAGIGHPARFFASLAAAGLRFEEMPLPDHHPFTAQTFAGCHADLILITEKDAVKCGEITALANDPRFWVVPVSAHIAAPFADHLLEKLRGLTTARNTGLPDLQRPA